MITLDAMDVSIRFTDSLRVSGDNRKLRELAIKKIIEQESA